MLCQKTISLIVIICFSVVTFGCASVPEEHKGAATGAGIGAATGVLAGALLGSKGAKTEMAILGGLLGALAGGLIGHYAYDQKKTKEQTAKDYNYKPSQGTLVRIENASATPKNIRRGETVDIRMTYAVLGAASGKDLTVTEVREIRHNGELVGKPQVSSSRSDGTYVTNVPITMPGDAKKGIYTVLMTVQADNMSDSREAFFSVQ